MRIRKNYLTFGDSFVANCPGEADIHGSQVVLLSPDDRDFERLQEEYFIDDDTALVVHEAKPSWVEGISHTPLRLALLRDEFKLRIREQRLLRSAHKSSDLDLTRWRAVIDEGVRGIQLWDAMTKKEIESRIQCRIPAKKQQTIKKNGVKNLMQLRREVMENPGKYSGKVSYLPKLGAEYSVFLYELQRALVGGGMDSQMLNDVFEQIRSGAIHVMQGMMALLPEGICHLPRRDVKSTLGIAHKTGENLYLKFGKTPLPECVVSGLAGSIAGLILDVDQNGVSASAAKLMLEEANQLFPGISNKSVYSFWEITGELYNSGLDGQKRPFNLDEAKRIKKGMVRLRTLHTIANRDLGDELADCPPSVVCLLQCVGVRNFSDVTQGNLSFLVDCEREEVFSLLDEFEGI